MFKRFLLPSDGSEASRRAVQSGVAFARSIGADVVGMTATPEFHTFTFDSGMLEQTRDQHDQASRARGQRLLDEIAAAAREDGVPRNVVQVVSDDPWDAIIDTARERHCDLIVMASHGRRGLSRLLTGSVTQAVLVHAPVPVMVLRP